MNQILISKKIYVTPEMKRKRKMYRILYTVSIITIIILLVYYVYAEKNRNDQEAVGKELLSQVDSDSTVVEENAIVFALDDNNEDQDEEEEIIPEQTIQNDEPIESKVKASNGSEYEIEAILSYPRLGINYSVLSEESESLLKVSLCKYWGPTPNSVGNYCIVGHNYKSGKMFGKLSMAQNGDEIILKDLSGKEVTYSVYTKYVVEPTDVSCTSQLTNGQREITLITCTNYGKERLVVKAREE